jgi:hypothetical protein
MSFQLVPPSVVQKSLLRVAAQPVSAVKSFMDSICPADCACVGWHTANVRKNTIARRNFFVCMEPPKLRIHKTGMSTPIPTCQNYVQSSGTPRGKDAATEREDYYRRSVRCQSDSFYSASGIRTGRFFAESLPCTKVTLSNDYLYLAPIGLW